MFDQSALREGMRVFGADGRRLGRVVRLDADGLLIEQGRFFPREYRASYRRVAEVRAGEVRLGREPAPEAAPAVSGGSAASPVADAEVDRGRTGDEEPQE